MSETVLRPPHKQTKENVENVTAFSRIALVAILTAATYYLTAKVGFAFALQPGSISILWMPNSILLASLLLIPRRWWWLVLLATVPAHFAAELQSGVPTMMVVSWFISNSTQAVIGAVAINFLVKGPLRFDRLTDVAIFIIFGASLAPLLASFLDVALIELNGWGHGSYWEIWRVRFLSNSLATLTLVPVILMWVREDPNVARSVPLLRYLELVALVTGLFIVGILAFSSPRNVAEQTPSLLYWPLPFLLWATVRFGPRGACTCLLIVMFLSILGAARGTGPFVAGTSLHNALSIQWFLIVVSIPLMVLAAVIEERRRAEQSARENEERLTLALNAAQMDAWDWSIPPTATNGARENNGNAGASPAISDPTFRELYGQVHPDDRAVFDASIGSALKDDVPYEVEFRRLQDTTTRWCLSKGKVLRDDNGWGSRMLGVGIDITDRKLAEQALIESSNRYQAVLRALPDMMFLHSKDGDYLEYYARDESALLAPPKDLLGKNLRDILPAEIADRARACIERLEATNDIQVMEYSVEIAGELRHYEARLVRADGDRILSVVREVTEARRAADALRQGEEKLLKSNSQIRALAARLMTAQDSERTRIALLLHDDVSQNIAAMGIAISRLKRKLPASSEELLAELDKLGQSTHDLTTQLRRLSHQLHPEVLEHVGLVAALKSQASEFSHEERIQAAFTADVSTEQLPLDLSVCLYRVALEALRNISRHSGAPTASITLKQDERFLTLEVADSGKGFDVEKARRGSGIGLFSAEERVKLLQGSFEIKSSSGTGTVLIARVPLGGRL